MFAIRKSALAVLIGSALALGAGAALHVTRAGRRPLSRTRRGCRPPTTLTIWQQNWAADVEKKRRARTGQVSVIAKKAPARGAGHLRRRQGRP